MHVLPVFYTTWIRVIDISGYGRVITTQCQRTFNQTVTQMTPMDIQRLLQPQAIEYVNGIRGTRGAQVTSNLQMVMRAGLKRKAFTITLDKPPRIADVNGRREVWQTNNRAHPEII